MDARTQRSTRTRTEKAGHWRHALAEQLHVQFSLDRLLFGSRVMPQRPTVEFGSGVAEAMQSVGTTRAATKVKVLHPEWDGTAVKAEGRSSSPRPGRALRIRSAISREVAPV
ncbi:MULTISPECIES: hypothetical protein [unclassified Streptomyces]|uniref:hypothetical protein n=1 Tax=unclassified Streptomyces TaxID=2593676 RepID=UPI00225ACAB8|nr:MULTISPECIES: hypothetical protein [unclassified Streptomyces]MCX4405866.1 hypothetical protein [Streptomyces sp. NBC_01764]MCX5189611.1 hypothetical protein [Streptomyces sp. NBC_00268]